MTPRKHQLIISNKLVILSATGTTLTFHKARLAHHNHIGIFVLVKEGGGRFENVGFLKRDDVQNYHSAPWVLIKSSNAEMFVVE
jgi:hypothetical protein